MKTLSAGIRRIAFGVLAVFAIAVPGRVGLARELGLDERIRAQEAIERAYYSHQLGATRRFEEAVRPEAIERKVRTYLKKSVALESLWGAPITAEMLAAEWKRIESGTRFPKRLQQIYQALGRDPVLIQECFVRPVLAERLLRQSYKTGAPGPAQDWDEWWSGIAPTLDERNVATIASSDYPSEETPATPSSAPPIAPATSCPPPDSWVPGILDDAPPSRVEHVSMMLSLGRSCVPSRRASTSRRGSRSRRPPSSSARSRRSSGGNTTSGSSAATGRRSRT
jgi:hypothetical protein